MEKEFIPYEQALALKELGFNEACFGLYAPPCKTVFLHHYGLLDAKEQHLAPLYRQAFRWFREKYKLHSYVFSDDCTKDTYGYHIDFLTKEDKDLYMVLGVAECEVLAEFKTQEEAELACLNKLIEIVKNK